jgi:molybdopterin converting factor small subunit
MPVLKFTRNLERFYPGLSPVKSAKTSLQELIDEADNKYPGIKDYILDEQNRLRKHVQIFIDNRMIHDRNHLPSDLRPEDEVYIMQALSGG